jgi:hypothetical protein
MQLLQQWVQTVMLQTSNGSFLADGSEVSTTSTRHDDRAAAQPCCNRH